MNQQPELLLVTSSPHVHTPLTTSGLMKDVVIALLPALCASIYIFGIRAGVQVAVSVLSCVGFEALFCRLRKWENTTFDLSAVVTGILLAFNLPVAAPLWLPVVGSFLAIFIVKMLFGGLGKNFVNPALIGRVFLANSWSSDMVCWTQPVLNPLAWTTAADAITGATPLGVVKSGVLPEAYTHAGQLWNMLLGVHGGCLGETCALLLIAGGLYLLARGVITWHIPTAYLGTVALLSLLFPPEGMSALLYTFYNLTGGGLLLGAFFMATDYATSPVTNPGRVIMGIGCGIFLFVIRAYASYPEGCSFAILLMNVATPLIDKYTMPKPFGEVKQHA